jgi:hypothetical protein
MAGIPLPYPLPNGAIEIESIRRQTYGLILAMFRQDNGEPAKAAPFVSWTFNIGENLSRGYYWGHYYNDIETAVKDYVERKKNIY